MTSHYLTWPGLSRDPETLVVTCVWLLLIVVRVLVDWLLLRTVVRAVIVRGCHCCLFCDWLSLLTVTVLFPVP